VISINFLFSFFSLPFSFFVDSVIECFALNDDVFMAASQKKVRVWSARSGLFLGEIVTTCHPHSMFSTKRRLILADQTSLEILDFTAAFSSSSFSPID